MADSDYCFMHDPDLAEERAAARSHGGKARHGRDIGPVGEGEPPDLAGSDPLIAEAVRVVWRLEDSIAKARTLAYIATSSIKVREFGELEERLTELEERANESKHEAQS